MYSLLHLLYSRRVFQKLALDHLCLYILSFSDQTSRTPVLNSFQPFNYLNTILGSLQWIHQTRGSPSRLETPSLWVCSMMLSVVSCCFGLIADCTMSFQAFLVLFSHASCQYRDYRLATVLRFHHFLSFHVDWQYSKHYYGGGSCEDCFCCYYSYYYYYHQLLTNC